MRPEDRTKMDPSPVKRTGAIFPLLFRTVGPILALLLLIPLSGLGAEKYLPPGYGSGQSVEGIGWDLSIGYSQINDDYYLNLKPLIEIPLFSTLRIGIQVPLEILVKDNDPKGTKDPPALREGTYDDIYDFTKVIAYIRYGTHLYYDPDDSFNWSVYYGIMNDGYIGHKTIIYRYVTSYDPTVFRAGMMADINNNWGGIEVFQSDVWRKEVIAGRGYIRPLGIFYGVRDLLYASASPSATRQLALSLYSGRDPDHNGGLFFQESDGSRGGSIRQYTHDKLRDVKFDDDTEVVFEEYTNPVTGETMVRAVPVKRKRGGVPGEETGKPGETTGKPGETTGKPGETTGKPGETTGKPGEGGVRTRSRPCQPGEPGCMAGDKPCKKGDQNCMVTETVGPDGKVCAPDDKACQREQRKLAEEEGKREKWGRTFWSRWAVGYTIARDHSAPLELERDGSNNLVIDPETNRPRAIKDEVMTIVGMDTEFRFSPVRWLELTPYVDVNRVKYLDKSEGTHIGIDSGLRFMNGLLKISFRPEYREFNSNYMPVYFDSYYSVERTAYVPGGNGSDSGVVGDDSQPKLEYLKSLSPDDGLTKGYFVEFLIEISQIMVFETTYEDYDGPNNSRIFVGIYVPNIFGFFLNGYYTKRGFERVAESFQFDNRSLAAGEVGYILLGAFYIKAGFQRTWEYNPERSAYVSTDEKTVNFGFTTGL